MKTRTNHGSEIELGEPLPKLRLEWQIFVFTNDPRKFMEWKRNNVTASRPEWVSNKTPPYVFYGLGNFFVIVLDGETLPRELQLEILRRNGVIRRREF